jgi:hypothetical protein
MQTIRQAHVCLMCDSNIDGQPVHDTAGHTFCSLNHLRDYWVCKKARLAAVGKKYSARIDDIGGYEIYDPDRRLLFRFQPNDDPETYVMAILWILEQKASNKTLPEDNEAVQ